MTDNCKINDFVRKYLEIMEAEFFNMTDFYHLHERFDRLSSDEKLSALFDILIYKEIKDKQ